jgi:predicted transcriptional regulator
MVQNDGFSDEKRELIHQLQTINSHSFFAQLRLLIELHQAQAEESFELTEADRQAIAAGRADVANGRVHTLEEFRQFFSKYEA